MSNERKFETVGGSGESVAWNPQLTEKNNFVLGTDNIREGYYIQVKEMPGNPQYGDKPYQIHIIHEVKPDGSFGQKWGVIGDKVLNDRMAQLTVGNFIRLEYSGKLRLKATPPTQNLSKTNSYHNWVVQVDNGAIPYNQAVSSSIAEGTPGVQSTNATASVTGLVNNANKNPVQNNSPFDESEDLPF